MTARRRLVAAVLMIAFTTVCRPPRRCPAQSIAFDDATAVSEVDFHFEAGSRGRHDLPEIMGGGVALFDADGDGLPDLYLCNGGPIDAPPGADDPPCRFFRNKGGLRFEDRTKTCSAPGPSYAMGAAAGDFDGDGRIDLFVTGWRAAALSQSRGFPVRRRHRPSRPDLLALERERRLGRPRRRRRPRSLCDRIPRLRSGPGPLLRSARRPSRLLRPRGLHASTRPPLSQRRRRPIHGRLDRSGNPRAPSMGSA